MDRHSGTNGLIAVVLIVLAIGVLAEVVAGRSVTTTSDLLRTTSWQALLDTGHRARARGDAPAARRAYLTALFRARGERSMFGMLSAAEGFKALGDGEVVERALAMAAALGPAGEADAAPTQLQALRDRLAATEVLPMTVPTTH